MHRRKWRNRDEECRCSRVREAELGGETQQQQATTTNTYRYIHKLNTRFNLTCKHSLQVEDILFKG